MQNTIVKRYLDNPNVETVILDQGNRNGETLERLLLVWSSFLLRGDVLFDEDGSVGGGILGQPSTGLPFARGFVIDRDGRVVLPYFGYDPATIISAIDELAPATLPVRRARGVLRPAPGAGLLDD